MTGVMFVAMYVFSTVFVYIAILRIIFERGDTLDDVSSVIIAASFPILNLFVWAVMQNTHNKSRRVRVKF